LTPDYLRLWRVTQGHQAILLAMIYPEPEPAPREESCATRFETGSVLVISRLMTEAVLKIFRNGTFLSRQEKPTNWGFPRKDNRPF
jgi:hypothetical protein